MDSNKVYVPNPQKWIRYYESMAKGSHNPYVGQNGGNSGKQMGGSLVGSPGTFMVPIETHKDSKSHQADPMTIKLVSPSEQVVQQAKAELQIEKKGIKRKNPLKKNSSSKRRRMIKTPIKSKGKKSVKKNRRYKRSQKTNIQKTKRKTPKGKKLKKRVNSNKKRLLKTDFKDIFA